eukprot:3669596-Pleurochrysis_carterae.AAC.8
MQGSPAELLSPALLGKNRSATAGIAGKACRGDPPRQRAQQSGRRRRAHHEDRDEARHERGADDILRSSTARSRYIAPTSLESSQFPPLSKLTVQSTRHGMVQIKSLRMHKSALRVSAERKEEERSSKSAQRRVVAFPARARRAALAA